MRGEKRLRRSAERCSQPATISTLPGTCSPLLRAAVRAPAGSCCASQARKTASSCLISPSSNLSAFHFAGKCFYSTIHVKETEREKRKWRIKVWYERRRLPWSASSDQVKSPPLDLLDVLEKRIAEVDGKVNALPTLCFDPRPQPCQGADEEAGLRSWPARRPAGTDQGPDCGGRRADDAGLADLQRQTSRPNPISWSSISKNNGGVIYAKSNTPEFGAGANTFNEVFGATRNPWDNLVLRRRLLGRRRPVALATGTAWLAHGSDMGGQPAQPPRASAASSDCVRASAVSRIRS